MPEQQLPGKGSRIILQYNGVFDFDGMYAAVIDWAKNYGYLWHEADYKHKVPSPSGAEQEFKWFLTKKVTTYLSDRIMLTVHMWDLLEVEVEENGKRKSLSSARLYIWLEPFVIHDWQRHWERSKVAETLGKWYNKIMQRDIEQYYDQLYYRTWNLHALLKKYFDMQAKKHPYKGYLGEN